MFKMMLNAADRVVDKLRLRLSEKEYFQCILYL